MSTRNATPGPSSTASLKRAASSETEDSTLGPREAKKVKRDNKSSTNPSVGSVNGTTTRSKDKNKRRKRKKKRKMSVVEGSVGSTSQDVSRTRAGPAPSASVTNGAVAAALAPPAARSSVSSTTRPTMQQAAEDIAVDSDSDSDEGDEHQDTVNSAPRREETLVYTPREGSIETVEATTNVAQSTVNGVDDNAAPMVNGSSVLNSPGPSQPNGQELPGEASDATVDSDSDSDDDVDGPVPAKTASKGKDKGKQRARSPTPPPAPKPEQTEAELTSLLIASTSDQPSTSAQAEVQAAEIARLTQQLSEQSALLQRHQAHLNTVQQSLTCQICLDLLHRPYALSSCGHVACYPCLLRWFAANPARHPDTPVVDPEDIVNNRVDNIIPAPQGNNQENNNQNLQQRRRDAQRIIRQVLMRRKTCPICRAVVPNRPVEVYSIKDMVASLVRSQLIDHPVPPEAANTPSGAQTPADPWNNIFPPVTRSRGGQWAMELDPAGAQADGEHRGNLQDMGWFDMDDGGIYRCLDCMHEIYGRHCSSCGREYPGHPEDDSEGESGDDIMPGGWGDYFRALGNALEMDGDFDEDDYGDEGDFHDAEEDVIDLLSNDSVELEDDGSDEEEAGFLGRIWRHRPLNRRRRVIHPHHEDGFDEEDDDQHSHISVSSDGPIPIVDDDYHSDDVSDEVFYSEEDLEDIPPRRARRDRLRAQIPEDDDNEDDDDDEDYVSTQDFHDSDDEDDGNDEGDEDQIMATFARLNASRQQRRRVGATRPPRTRTRPQVGGSRGQAIVISDEEEEDAGQTEGDSDSDIGEMGRRSRRLAPPTSTRRGTRVTRRIASPSEDEGESDDAHSVAATGNVSDQDVQEGSSRGATRRSSRSTSRRGSTTGSARGGSAGPSRRNRQERSPSPPTETREQRRQRAAQAAERRRRYP
ncbi:hypothetical protein CC1G_10329 [Coprinopsis cinerea okayama7|uniref:RING-type domain-containing protein n=1 Tax=Coprinopsis cinerea (strain Okayama-7 / 130 / ATCC MYA-4618 / FGSC 9003) TaxID=240176 RepID=A8P0J9_COPC7|nr:hypothetical protein CC1G_10329 [Coprinopsis cinerea okayama7\|eukprot:XP_001837908.2 hypothetical protein CC1G_10329 [Coprinopsis cinerea okayama7\